MRPVSPEARISRVELGLTIQESGPPFPYRLDIFTLKGGFGEGEVTWNNQPELGQRYSTGCSTRVLNRE